MASPFAFTTTTIPTLAELGLALAVAAAAGLVGTIAVMRRLTLASDAMAHIALPGVGIAIMLRLNPVLGAAAALGLGAVLIWALGRRTSLPTEAIIGVTFSAALAIGSLITSGEELIDALFGAAPTLAPIEIAVGIAGAAVVIGYLLRARSRLVIALVSEDLARTSGIDVPRVNLIFLLAFAATVALGLRFLGVLLMGSLIIIPAATAKHVARSLASMQVMSVSIAMLATLAGLLAAPLVGVPPGPLIILVAALVFFVGLVLRPVR